MEITMKRKITLLGMTLSFLLLTSCGSYKITKDYDPKEFVKLGEYKGIEVTLTSAEVTDEEVETRMQADLDSYSTYETTTARGIKETDKVNIDLQGTVDDKIITGFTTVDYDLIIGANQISVDGFDEGILGYQTGDTAVVSLVLPEDFTDSAIAGKDIVFTVKINSIQEKIIPDLTDDFINTNLDYKTVNEYREATKALLTEEKVKAAETARINDVWIKVVNNVETLGYPEGQVESQIEQLKAQFDVYASINKVDVEEFVQNYYGISIEEYAQTMVTQILTLEAIAIEEEIELSDSEYKKLLPEYAALYGTDDTDAFVEKHGQEKIKEAMLWDKVKEFLSDSATVIN